MSLKNAFVAILAFGAIIGIHAKPPSRIVGGRLAAPEEFHSIVLLTPVNNFAPFCGGTIIGPRHILTAAHCVDKRTAEKLCVRAGIHRVGATDDIVTNVQQIILHPDYVSYIKDQRSLENDIALLVLEKDIPLGDRASKLDLPTHQPDTSRIYWAAGWGKNGKDTTEFQFDLKVLGITLADTALCNTQRNYSPANPPKLCGINDAGTVCRGDSGGPLTNLGTIYGVISASVCDIGVSSTFVNVYHYIDWINAKISQTSSH